MSWPLSHEFNEAIQNPRTAFLDPDLRNGEAVVGATGLPLPRSGNFADVYQVRGADRREWAVKCFTRPVAGLDDRYAKVSQALAKANLPFAVGFTFLNQGMRVAGAFRPVVKMEWVEGLLLNQVARAIAGNQKVLSALSQMWVKLCKQLREAGIAHADIQHGNVMLVPDPRAGASGLSLKLIDYDGMWVPALANTPSGEAGHSSYQHPARAATRAYSPDVDRFPQLAIATALRGLLVGGSALWGKYDNGDNVLFTEKDYKKPAESELLKELWHAGDPQLQSLVGRLAIACGKPIPQTPWLDQLAPEGEPTPLDNATRRAAASALGVSLPAPVPVLPVPVVVARPPEPRPLPPEPEPNPFAFSPPPPRPLTAERKALPSAANRAEPEDDRGEERSEKGSKTKPTTKLGSADRASKSQLYLFVGGAPLLLVVVFLAGVLLGGGNQKPTLTAEPSAQPKPDEPKAPDPKKTGDAPKPKNKGTGEIPKADEPKAPTTKGSVEAPKAEEPKAPVPKKTGETPKPPDPVLDPVVPPGNDLRVRFPVTPGFPKVVSFAAQVPNGKKKAELIDVTAAYDALPNPSFITAGKLAQLGYVVPKGATKFVLPELLVPATQIAPKVADVAVRFTNLSFTVLAESPHKDDTVYLNDMYLSITALFQDRERALDPRLSFSDKFMELTVPPTAVKRLGTDNLVAPAVTVSADTKLVPVVGPTTMRNGGPMFTSASINGLDSYTLANGKTVPVNVAVSSISNLPEGVVVTGGLARGVKIEMDPAAVGIPGTGANTQTVFAPGKIKELRLGVFTGPGLKTPKELVLTDLPVRVDRSVSDGYVLISQRFLDAYFTDAVYANSGDGWKLHGRIYSGFLFDPKSRIDPTPKRP